MLNPIFWKKVHGQKHPGRWEIAEPCVKMLFKTNTNGHRHPSISLFISHRAWHNWWNQRKQVAFNTGIAHSPKNSPIDCDAVQLRQYWTTLPVYVYTSYNQSSYKECIRTYKCILTQSFWTGTKVIRRKHIVQPTGFGAYSSTCY